MENIQYSGFWGVLIQINMNGSEWGKFSLNARTKGAACAEGGVGVRLQAVGINVGPKTNMWLGA